MALSRTELLDPEELLEMEMERRESSLGGLRFWGYPVRSRKLSDSFIPLSY